MNVVKYFVVLVMAALMFSCYQAIKPVPPVPPAPPLPEPAKTVAVDTNALNEARIKAEKEARELVERNLAEEKAKKEADFVAGLHIQSTSNGIEIVVSGRTLQVYKVSIDTLKTRIGLSHKSGVEKIAYCAGVEAAIASIKPGIIEVLSLPPVGVAALPPQKVVEARSPEREVAPTPIQYRAPYVPPPPPPSAYGQPVKKKKGTYVRGYKKTDTETRD